MDFTSLALCLTGGRQSTIRHVVVRVQDDGTCRGGVYSCCGSLLSVCGEINNASGHGAEASLNSEEVIGEQCFVSAFGCSFANESGYRK